jgi:mono/diheme cytochrome c family protein
MRRMVRTLPVAAIVLGLTWAASLRAASPGLATEKDTRAQQAYLAYCAMCHGPRGAGDGEVATALKRSSIIVPRLDDAARLAQLGRSGVLRIILEGGAHVGRSNVMPEWSGLLGENLADGLADFVMSLSQQEPGLLATARDNYLKSPAGVPEDGRKLFVYHCSACHGPAGRGDGPSGLVLWRKHGVRPRNLADTRYMRTKTDQDLFTVISLGSAHMGKSAYMQSWANALSPAQIKGLVAYLRLLSKSPSRR